MKAVLSLRNEGPSLITNDLKSQVTYQLAYPDCNAQYIGKNDGLALGRMIDVYYFVENCDDCKVSNNITKVT